MLQELKGVLVPHMELLMSRGDAHGVAQGQSLKATVRRRKESICNM